MTNSFTYEPFREFTDFDKYIFTRDLLEFCVNSAKRFGDTYVYRDSDQTFLILLTSANYPEKTLSVILTEGETNGTKVFVCKLMGTSETKDSMDIIQFVNGPWVNRCELLFGCEHI